MLSIRKPTRAKHYPALQLLEVTFNSDGNTVITCDSFTAARLAGRDIFGQIEDAQKTLRTAICDNWYASGCPTTP